ncbi:MAG: GNAT family N-acetyltransferase [Pseudomonadota bacterium]
MIHVRDTDFFRPTVDAIDWSAFADAIAAPAEPVDRSLTRMLGEIVPPRRPIGVYSLGRQTGSLFDIDYLAVAPEFRGQGFGRRLLGHALGLAESKGGRVVDICAPDDRSRAVFTRYGFEPTEDERRLRFVLPPE